jgi:hypothetical protein
LSAAAKCAPARGIVYLLVNQCVASACTLIAAHDCKRSKGLDSVIRGRNRHLLCVPRAFAPKCPALPQFLSKKVH